MRIIRQILIFSVIILFVEGDKSMFKSLEQELPKLNLEEFNGIKWAKSGLLSSVLTSSGKAFRDVAMESVLHRIFDKYLAQDKLTEILHFSDPLHLQEGFEIDEESKLMEINFLAKDISISGLSSIKVDYLRVVRHFGLNDLKLMLTLNSDIVITGRYKLKGTALAGLLPLDGNGDFKIAIDNCKMSTVVLAASTKDMKLIMQELEIGIGFEKQSFEFENLMGGGVMGQTASTLMNTMGKLAFDKNMDILKDFLKDGYRSLIETIL